MKRDWHSMAGTAIVVLTTWASIVAGWSTLGERTEVLRDQHVDHERRIREIERSRVLDDKIEKLTIQITELRGEVAALRVELAAAKGEVVRVHARRR